ncbi:MAG: hypothetical protein M3247_08725 [Thermoproteota archaeon]|nr:hypothetical protein [Acidobacteriota bacterium]MDQ3903707.1 hypothetical protein [Thermoproteota archaeon]
MKDQRLKNKEWRISHLYKIKDKNQRLIQFSRNRAQEHYKQNQANRNLLLKSRQLGFTTDEAIDTTDDVLFTPNFDALLIAHKKEEALKIFDNKIDLAWKNFPDELKPLWEVDTERANTLKFGFGDGSYSSISVAISGRSGTYNRVHISEFAKLCAESPKAAKEIITGTIPSVPLDGRIDIEGTAEGEDNLFALMFWEAWTRQRAKKPTEFKAHFYNWTWDDEEIAKVTQAEAEAFKQSGDYLLFKDYQAKHGLTDIQITYYYYKWLSLNKDWKSLRQEYPTTPEEAFVSSGNKLFDPDKLDKFELREGEKNGDWTYYAEYNSIHRYGMGCDVAEGVGQDSSTITIWDFDAKPKPEVVAEFKSNTIEPDVFAYEIRNGGIKYGMAIAGVERNNHGHATLAKLKEIYPIDKIFKEVKKDQVTDKYTEKLGWHSNAASKPQILFALNTVINEEAVNIPSKTIKYELRTYDKTDVNKTTFDEEATQHWDLVRATAIGWKMNEYAESELPVIKREQELEQVRERKRVNYAR